MISIGLGLVTLGFYQSYGDPLPESLNNNIWAFDDPAASAHLLTCGIF